jgi:hypothetical protein
MELAVSRTSWPVSGNMAKFVILAVVAAVTIFAVPSHEWIGRAFVIVAALFVSVSAPVSGAAGVLAPRDVAPARVPTPSRHLPGHYRVHAAHVWQLTRA